MIGTKFTKPLDELAEERYTQAAEWCNSTQQGYIVDKGEYYEICEIPAPTLEEAQASKIAQLKAARDAAEIAPVEYQDSLFDFDTKSFDRINAAIIALDGGGTIGWTTAENTVVIVTANDLRGVVAAAAIRSNELHVKYRTLKEQVLAAQTNEEVNAIVWTD